MIALLFLAYVVVEIGVLAWLGSTLGIGATILLFLGVSVLGYLVLAAQGRRALQNLGRVRSAGADRAGFAGAADRALTDGALIGVGAALVLVPGPVTSAAGILLLLPPTRALLRPAVRAVAARKVAASVARGGGFRGERIVVVDGEVVEHTVVGTPRLGAAAPGAGTVLEGEIVDPPQRPHLP
ncbi:FxsA family protein [Rhodococcus sp. 14C212]|uniref:FxsA family protein n=1 Tax=Rhodococcus sp. 14C212 TaxID=2711209 RepID=UPI0013EE0A59|nr:FxsA family protein [Rhodococcus sp. 14C212]NGP08709.1 FxsA family protein [Rhodococcus sp. 14C212]